MADDELKTKQQKGVGIAGRSGANWLANVRALLGGDTSPAHALGALAPMFGAGYGRAALGEVGALGATGGQTPKKIIALIDQLRGTRDFERRVIDLMVQFNKQIQSEIVDPSMRAAEMAKPAELDSLKRLTAGNRSALREIAERTAAEEIYTKQFGTNEFDLGAAGGGPTRGGGAPVSAPGRPNRIQFRATQGYGSIDASKLSQPLIGNPEVDALIARLHGMGESPAQIAWTLKRAIGLGRNDATIDATKVRARLDVLRRQGVLRSTSPPLPPDQQRDWREGRMSLGGPETVAGGPKMQAVHRDRAFFSLDDAYGYTGESTKAKTGYAPENTRWDMLGTDAFDLQQAPEALTNLRVHATPALAPAPKTGYRLTNGTAAETERQPSAFSSESGD